MIDEQDMKQTMESTFGKLDKVGADNSEKAARIERLKPHQFKPGVSGNPGGRPKNTLKEFQGEEFRNMTPEEKRDFLRGIAKIDRWKMAEGNPKQDTELAGKDGEPIEFLVKLTDDNSTSGSINSNEGQSSL